LQKIKRVEGFLDKRKKGQGPLAKLPCLPLPPDRNRGGEDRGAGGVDPGTPGLGGGWDVGEKREEASGTRFPVLPRAGTAREGGATRAAGGGRSGCGGGAARPGRRRAGLGGFVEGRRCAERLFKGVARRWRGEAPVVASRQPLMAPRRRGAA
jgi:hypothetical protein